MRISASDVAAVCDMHPYRSRADTLVAYAKINAPELYTHLKGVDREHTTHWRARANSLVAKEVLTRAIASDETFDAVLQQVGETSADPTRDIEAVRSAVYTSRGIRDETPQLDAYETSSSNKVCARNSKMYTVVADTSVGPLHIRGKIDGALEDGTVVEHKRRQNRLFHTVPEYERVQVHVYMHMTGARRAILVESYGETQASHTVEWDAEFWGDILGRLDRFVTAFAGLDSSYASVAAAVDHFHALSCQGASETE